MFKESKLDVETDEDMTGSTAKLVLPKPRLRHGKLVIRTEWNDVHVYSFAPWVRQLLLKRTTLSSIQNDVLPLLISRQFKGKIATFGSSLNKDDDEDGGGDDKDDKEGNATTTTKLEKTSTLNCNTKLQQPRKIEQDK